MDDVSKEIGEFLDYSFGTTPGFAYFATLTQGTDFKQYMITWPTNRQRAITFVQEQNARQSDIFYCPNLFAPLPDGSKPRPLKEHAIATGMIVVDFDNQSAPDDWEATAKELGIPEPTQVLQSSVPGNQHVYWKVEGFEPTTDPEKVDWIEERSRALAARLSGDMSGWDINQLLRLPHTNNQGIKGTGERKDWYQGEPQETTILRKGKGTVPAAGFDVVRIAEKEAFDRLDINLSTLPDPEIALMLGPTTQEIVEFIAMTKEEASASSPEGRSGSLMRLAYMLAETGGFTDEQIYSVLQGTDLRWEKYSKRHKSDKHKRYLDCVARAREKHGYMSLDDVTFAGILNAAKNNDEPQEEKFIYDLEEFLSEEFNFDWILEGLISRQGRAVITGQPGVGKTQFILDVVMSLALGLDYLNWKNVQGPVKVLMLSLEMGKPALQMFWRQVAADPKYDDMPTLKKNLKIIPAGTEMELNRPEVFAFFNSLLAELKPDIAVIDSFQMMTGDSLSDDKEMRLLMRNVKKLGADHDCGIIMIHHERKKQPGAKNDPGSLSDMYGSQYIAANVDKVISLSADVEMPGQVLMAEWKSNLSKLNDNAISLERSKYLTFNVAANLGSGFAPKNPDITADEIGLHL